MDRQDRSAPATIGQPGSWSSAIDDVAKQFDFGLIPPRAGSPTPHLTGEGQVLGTPLSMAPEQVMSGGPLLVRPQRGTSLDRPARFPPRRTAQSPGPMPAPLRASVWSTHWDMKEGGEECRGERETGLLL